MAIQVDFEVGAYRIGPASLVATLDGRIDQLMNDIRASEVWSAVMAPEADPLFIRAVLREIYLEIYMYQAESLQAAVAAIGQFPRIMPVVWFDEMLHHQVEEFDHGEMALRDYVAMGGSEIEARARRQAPSAFAVSALWRNIAANNDPFLYLGAVYLFDGLTPVITGLVQHHLKDKMGSASGLEFIVHHATADLEHRRELGNLIGEVAAMFPEQCESIFYGFEYFAHVYPLPGWRAALRRAERQQKTLAAE